MGVTLNFLPRSRTRATPPVLTLRGLRKELGLTQGALGRRSGLCRSTISRVECHPEQMSAQYAQKITAGTGRLWTLDENGFRFLSVRETDLIRLYREAAPETRHIVIRSVEMIAAGRPRREVSDMVFGTTGIRIEL